MRVTLVGQIFLVTGATFSVASEALKRGSHLIHPTFNGRLYCNGSGIRGALRHANALLIMEEMAKLGKKLRLIDFYWLALGGVKQAGDTQFDVLTELPMLRQHVFGGTWGFSEPMFNEGAIQVEHALANSGVFPIIIYGQRRDPVQTGEIDRSLIADPDSFDEYLARLGANREKRRQERKETGNKKVEKKSNQDAELIEQPTNLPHSREIIPPETTLPHHITIRHCTEIQLGMLVATFRAFARDPYLGARVGQNLGLCDMEYMVKVDGKEVGKIAISGRDLDFEISNSLSQFEDGFWQTFNSIDWHRPAIKGN